MKTLLFTLTVTSFIPLPLVAAEPVSGVVRTPLLTAHLEPEKTIAAVQITSITLGPGIKTGAHMHPVPVVGVVEQGSVEFQVEGETVQHLHAGEAFFEPANRRIEHFDNEGASPVRFTAFYLSGANDRELIRMLTK